MCIFYYVKTISFFKITENIIHTFLSLGLKFAGSTLLMNIPLKINRLPFFQGYCKQYFPTCCEQIILAQLGSIAFLLEVKKTKEKN